MYTNTHTYTNISLKAYIHGHLVQNDAFYIYKHLLCTLSDTALKHFLTSSAEGAAVLACVGMVGAGGERGVGLAVGLVGLVVGGGQLP